MMRAVALAAVLGAAALAVSAGAVQCGEKADGALCPNCLCCSQYGYCGSTSDYCGEGCQSQCTGSCTPPPPPPPGPGPPSPSGGGVASIITEALFESMFKNRNDVHCTARGFFTYDAFIAAADAFPGFGTTGDTEVRKRELAAFLGQTGHETTGGWPEAPDGAFTWGYCYKEELGGESGPDYCKPSTQWPCVPGKKYFGRGPIQLTWNYNYGPAGQHPAIGQDLLSNPELVASDPVVSFKTAIWFWMTPRPPNKPSCHEVATGQWTPTDADEAAGRLPGYGVITNIINGGQECGHGYDERVANRTFFYTSYCNILGISYGDNLDCYNQRSFDTTFLAGAGTSTATLENHADA